MILLFGDKATKNASTTKTNSVKNTPVENSGILAMNFGGTKSLLTVAEYDSYVSSSPVVVDYTMYADSDFSGSESGFMSDFSAAVAVLGDCGFSSGGFDCGGASYSSCSSS